MLNCDKVAFDLSLFRQCDKKIMIEFSFLCIMEEELSL